MLILLADGSLQNLCLHKSCSGCYFREILTSLLETVCWGNPNICSKFSFNNTVSNNFRLLMGLALIFSDQVGRAVSRPRVDGVARVLERVRHRARILRRRRPSQNVEVKLQGELALRRHAQEREQQQQQQRRRQQRQQQTTATAATAARISQRADSSRRLRWSQQN